MANVEVSINEVSMDAKLMTIAISNVEGCKFAHIRTETVVKIPKKYGIFGEVKKICDKRIQINYDYETAVNNRRKREGKEPNFKAQSLPWGTWVIDNKIITHKGNIYLRTYDFKGGLIDKTYFVEGCLPTADELKIINEYEQSKNKASNTQGLEEENEVRPNVVNVENILYFKCGNEEFHKLAEGEKNTIRQYFAEYLNNLFEKAIAK